MAGRWNIQGSALTRIHHGFLITIEPSTQDGELFFLWRVANIEDTELIDEGNVSQLDQAETAIDAVIKRFR